MKIFCKPCDVELENQHIAINEGQLLKCPKCRGIYHYPYSIEGQEVSKSFQFEQDLQALIDRAYDDGRAYFDSDFHEREGESFLSLKEKFLKKWSPKDGN